MRIAYAGAEGAFAHQACLAFAGGMEPVAVESFAAVVSAVERGEAACGMLPLHNSRAGEVRDAVALIERSAVRVIARSALPVRMHLLGLPGGTLERLRLVRSHPMALKQCSRALTALGLPVEEAPNTAVAARTIEDASVGVLASEAAAEAYGLNILRRDMQDDPDNSTIFGIVERNSEGER
ncbi:MAG TPA: prephenate dehydratase domain-containing protein [Allosphingosinicella sp.]|jgi:prephenate dehydratase